MKRFQSVLAGLLLFGCVNNSELIKRQDSLSKEVEEISQICTEGADKIEKVAEKSEKMRQDIGRLWKKALANSTAYEAISKKVKEIEGRKPATEETAAETVGKQPAAAHDRPYVTPEDYGAVADDKKDDTEAFKKLFAERHGKIIFIPGKSYRISDTIVMPKKAGYHVIGGGFNSTGIRPEHSMMGNASRIVWVGGPDKPMFVMHGRGLIWDGVELRGRPWYKKKTDRPRAKIGFLVAKDGRGIGVGKMWFPAMSITECETGFQAGTREGEHNCDNLIFGYLTVGNCKYGFRTRNHMAMDIHIHYVKGGGSMDVMFYFERGGAAHIQGMGMHSSRVKTLIKIGWNGVNNGYFSFNNIKIDAQAKNLKILEMEKACPSVIVINKLKRSGGKNMRPNLKGCFELKGNAVLTIRDSQQIVGPECFLTEADKQGNVPNVLLDRCDFPEKLTAKDLHDPASKGDWNFATRNCFSFGSSHRPLKDISHVAGEKK